MTLNEEWQAWRQEAVAHLNGMAELARKQGKTVALEGSDDPPKLKEDGSYADAEQD